MKPILHLALALLLALPLTARAGVAQPLATDPALEQRMVNLTSELRCLVCQDESLAASQADLAKDLRGEIRGMMRRGMTDRQIVAFLVARYGNFVRFRPPVDAETLPLWGGPFAFALVGIAGLLLLVRARRAAPPAPPLDPAQRERAQNLLRGSGDQT